MDSQEICGDEQRRRAVRGHLNGIDYVDVGDDGRTLSVYLFGAAPADIVVDNVQIEGGVRVRDIRVVAVRVGEERDQEREGYLEVNVDKPGDFSTYTLSLVGLEGFDPRYAHVNFGFQVGGPTDVDCGARPALPPVDRVEPEIDYLAKDYASFRQLALDRMALTMPAWKERHGADLGIALVEILAYVGDHLSYYQDAVATEAYLGTARQRISIRRHARLVDYQIHEGCNARVWVYVEVAADVPLNPDDVDFITEPQAALGATGPVLNWDALASVPADSYEVFRPVMRDPIHLHTAHNKIHFYTWRNQQCVLPKGATAATLLDGWADDQSATQTPNQTPASDLARRGEKAQPTPPSQQPRRRKLANLKPGDVLIFEEMLSPSTGDALDADPTHRHVVRLTQVNLVVDELDQQPVVEIAWATPDALPFSLTLSMLAPPPSCKRVDCVSVARGNVILADHGRRRAREDIPDCVPVTETAGRCEGEGLATEPVVVAGRFRPKLPGGPLTWSQPLAEPFTAAGALVQDPRRAVPQVDLVSAGAMGQGQRRWLPQPDLLSSESDDAHYVVETDDDGRAHLRFGDGELGRAPDPGCTFTAAYRIGNGPAGNVGAETITRLVLGNLTLSGAINAVRNPLPAVGGMPPEPVAEIRLLAPSAFRNRLGRAITTDDYARLAERHPGVQRAAATLRWTGSRYEVRVAIDPLGTENVSSDLLREIESCLEPYRRIGHDLEVVPALYVPIRLEITITVLAHYLRGHVKMALLGVFGNGPLPDGRRGFFDPDNLTFGDSVYLSRLVAAAQAVTGVEIVRVTRLERLFDGPNGEVDRGVLSVGPLEIAQLDNDPNRPEHGVLRLTLVGGR